MSRIEKFMPHLWGYLLCLFLVLVVDFYWPGGNTIQVQFMAWEFGAMAVIVFSYLFYPVRISKNPWPAFFLIYAFLNCFSHGLIQFTLIGLTQVLLFTISFYALVNSLNEKHISFLKKTIVFIAVVNAAFGIGQKFGYSPVFDTKEVMGLMGQKWNFAVLCGIALPFAVEMGWLPSLLIITGILLADKYAVYIPLFACLFLNRNRFKVNSKIYYSALFFILALVGIKKLIWFSSSPDHLHGDYELKVMPRVRHWKSMIQYSLARPIDGWGINSFNSIVFDKEHPNNYAEMHNEPLQVAFEGGAIAVGIIAGWVRSVIQKVKLTSLSDIESSALIFVSASFFHSVFHQGNMLFLFLIILSILEVETNAKTDSFKRLIEPAGSPAAMPVLARHLPTLGECAASNGRS